MSEKDTNEHYANLAAKYLSGNSTQAEVQELEAWVSVHSENKEQFEEYKKLWLLTKIEQNRKAIDVADNWQQVQQQLFEKEARVIPLQTKKQSRKWLSIAATIALVLVGGWAYFTYFQNQELYFANAQNEPRTIELADGSQVILNQASSIRFSIDKKEKQRAVELTGDAFFDVAREEKMPFKIQAANVEVEVLGTSFYVDARAKEDAIQVMVESGKVAVRTNESEQILNPNEQAIYSKVTQKLTKQSNEDNNFNALKTNTLTFEDASLEDVVFALNRQYNSNINLSNEALKDCKIDATYKDKSLNAILAILSSTLGIEVEQNGEGIVLSGACDSE